MLQLDSARVVKITTLADRTLRIQLELRELKPEEMASLMFSYMSQEEGVALEEVIVDETETKSPSQRLRGVLFKLWERNKEGLEQFDLYYRKKMGGIIDKLKEKLN